jgi:hypothetical protein
MWLQNLGVAFLVSVCFAYAANQLLPLAVRQALATALLHLPLPVFVAQALQKVTQTSAGCGCHGCDRAPTAQSLARAGQKSTEHTLVFHPPPKRP